MDLVNSSKSKLVKIIVFFCVTLSILGLGQLASAASLSMYDVVLKGKSCSEGRNQQLDCDYKIGSDFWLSIAAVGSPIATAHFMKSNSAGKYYASYASAHDCVMVMRGDYFKDRDLLDVAYVSLKNGKVYKDWTSCQSSQ